MKTHLLVAAAAAAALAFLGAAPARADMIAGWDFSQYFGAGFLSTDGVTFTDTLDANYSNLDPTFGAGAESAAFGTLYMNGAFGSTDVAVGTGLEPFFPTTNSLLSNLDAGVPGSEPFDSFTVLDEEDQTFTMALRMTASAALDVVFAADLGSLPGTLGSDWSVSFGGQTFSGSAPVEIAFSSDGASYETVTSVNLTAVDTVFDVPLSAEATDAAFVRFRFPTPAGGGEGQTIVDNVAIVATLPEPGASAATVALLTLLALGRRRSRSSP